MDRFMEEKSKHKAELAKLQSQLDLLNSWLSLTADLSYINYRFTAKFCWGIRVQFFYLSSIKRPFYLNYRNKHPENILLSFTI